MNRFKYLLGERPQKIDPPTRYFIPVRSPVRNTREDIDMMYRIINGYGDMSSGQQRTVEENILNDLRERRRLYSNFSWSVEGE